MPVRRWRPCAAHAQRYVSDATEKLKERIDAKDLNGEVETVELREALEQVQAISLEIGEELDAYQSRHAR